MTPEKVKGLQNLQLSMMKIIHKICQKDNIEYYIIGGTALGSVRHQGFIPWDIDIDIAMTRKNYDMFKEVALCELPSQMKYVDHTCEADYRSPHAKVEWIKSSITIAKDGHISKAFIDIFPLDYAPNDVNLQRKQAKYIKALKFLKSCKILSKSRNLNVSFPRKLFFYVFRLFNPFINIDKINVRMQELMQKYDSNPENAYFLCSMASHYSYRKQCIPKEIYGRPTLIKFSDTEFYGPELIDAYLSRIYGDYMTLPSKKEQ